jgi:hypothetical protein
VGAEAHLDLAKRDVRWNDELQRLDVALEARVGKRRFDGDLEFAFHIARQVGVGGLPATLRVIDEPVACQRVTDGVLVLATARSKQLAMRPKLSAPRSWSLGWRQWRRERPRRAVLPLQWVVDCLAETEGRPRRRQPSQVRSPLLSGSDAGGWVAATTRPPVRHSAKVRSSSTG